LYRHQLCLKLHRLDQSQNRHVLERSLCVGPSGRLGLSQNLHTSTGEPFSSGAHATSSGKPARSGGHRQTDTAPSTRKVAATAEANGGLKPRLTVKPPKRQQLDREEESQSSSSSEAEISDSDDAHEQNHGIKLKIKGRSSKQGKAQADSDAQDSAAELSRAQKVVRGILKLKAAAPFSRPVNEEEVPGYYQAVQQPMDLGSVSEKLKNGEYRSLGRACCPAAALATWSFMLSALPAWLVSCSND